MREELTLPAWRPMDPNDRVRQAHAIAELIATPPRRRVRRMVLTIGTGTVLVATIAAGAAAYFSETPTVRSSVYCYTSAGTSAQDLGTETNYRAADQDAVAICAALWEIGDLHLGLTGPTPPSTAAEPSALPVPPLVACVLHGEAAVFPGDASTCQRLGLPVLAKKK
jgi:hypothetical protein